MYNFSTVPQFFISPEIITVDEATNVVQVCVNLNGTVDSSVVVTTGTQTKTGATNQATGKNYCHIIIFLSTI